MRNGQGSVSGELLNWEDGKISLKSPYFGEASFVESIFQSFEFGAIPLKSPTAPTTVSNPSLCANSCAKIFNLKLSFSNWNDNSI
jgi:hypothetical protein|tara:strand:- start:431 stop:685 length:255 start_codon:yes stop_codon:yes gene_type:complete